MKNIQIKRKTQSIPKMSIGGIVSDSLSSGFSGAASGAALGVPGAIIGAAIGLGSGLYKGITGDKAEKEAKKREDELKITEENLKSANRLSNFNSSGYNQPMFLQGGGTNINQDSLNFHKALNRNRVINSQTGNSLTTNNQNKSNSSNKSVNDTKYIRHDNPYIQTLDYVGRNIALAPQQLSKLTNVVFSPFTGRSIYENWDDFYNITPEEYNNAYSSAPRYIADNLTDLLIGKMAGSLIKRIHSGLSKMKMPEPVKEVVDATIKEFGGTPKYSKLYSYPKTKVAPSTTTPLRPKTSDIKPYFDFEVYTRPKNGLSKGGTVLPIAPDVKKVKASVKGTDTVKHKLNNMPVMLDNNEHIVNVDGIEYVVSDDLGETKLHKELLKTMPAKYANKIIANRAIQLQKLNNSSNYKMSGAGTNILPSLTPIGLNPTGLKVKPGLNPSISNSSLPKLKASNLSEFVGFNIKKPFETSSELVQLADAGLALANSLNNISTYSKLNKLKLPTPTFNTPILQNNKVNLPIFNNQLNDIDSSFNQLKDLTLSTSSDYNTAFSKLNTLAANKESLKSKVYANLLSDVGNINNSNIKLQNDVNLQNNLLSNQNKLDNYNRKLNIISSGNSLINSSITSAQSFVDNIKKNNYDNETLAALAKSYGINWKPGDDINSFYTQMIKKLTQ